MVRLSARAIDEQHRFMMLRQRQFRIAADALADAFAALPEVERVALIGSVARPLEREVPRFREYRRAGIAVWHECKDLDLAVWLDRLDQLESLRRLRARTLQQLYEGQGLGVADHQAEIFILEPGANRYLGRLCLFNSCPKGKRECLVPGCGEHAFLRRHAGFRFEPDALAPGRCLILFDRLTGARRRATSLPDPPLDGSDR